MRCEHRHRRLLGAGFKGVWRGIDVDVCRARRRRCSAMRARCATPLTTQQRFTPSSPARSISCRATPHGPWRATRLGLNFVGVNYYDGQGFMVPKKLKITKAQSS
jgi:general L-amino acid transport system substrate-binding protein